MNMSPILILDPASPVPPYEQIGAQIRLHIATGRLPPGAPLPSVRQLARDLRVAPNTVVRAYKELEREGWVRSSARRGVAVAQPSPAQMEQVRTETLERAIAQLLEIAHQLGITPAQVQVEIDRLLSSRPILGSHS
ncbi:MAG: GntR family transcriptional regulator [Ktedonobacterales bacterium]